MSENSSSPRNSRRGAREEAIKLVYEADMAGADGAEIARSRIEEAVDGDAPDEARFFSELVEGAIRNIPLIDSRLADLLDNWTPERLGYMERAILRVALFELLCERVTPGPVVINEAVELAKRFCDGESTKLINGVLDKAWREVDNKNNVT